MVKDSQKRDTLGYNTASQKKESVIRDHIDKPRRHCSRYNCPGPEDEYYVLPLDVGAGNVGLPEAERRKVSEGLEAGKKRYWSKCNKLH